MSAERRVMLAMQEQPVVLLPVLFLLLLAGRGLDCIIRASRVTFGMTHVPKKLI